ncbi:unnamed protein product, partial [Pylaiella littoralis]
GGAGACECDCEICLHEMRGICFSATAVCTTAGGGRQTAGQGRVERRLDQTSVIKTRVALHCFANSTAFLRALGRKPKDEQKESYSLLSLLRGKFGAQLLQLRAAEDNSARVVVHARNTLINPPQVTASVS